MGKKKHSSKSAKKKKGSKAGGSGASASTGRGSVQRESRSGVPVNLSGSEGVPAFQDQRQKQRGRGPTKGLCHKYKASTERVRDWLRKASSSTSGEESGAAYSRVDSVADLSRAAERIYAGVVETVADGGGSLNGGAVRCADDGNGEVAQAPLVLVDIPRSVLRDLDEAIDLREATSKGFELRGGADDGHRFMIDTLKHCRRVLGLSRRIGRFVVKARRANRSVSDAVSGSDGVSEIGGRFSALLQDDEDEGDEGIDDDAILNGSLPEVPRPEETPETARLSIEDDLIKGSDRFRSILFLKSLEQLMGVIDQHFGLLKKAMHGDPSAVGVKDSELQLLMECIAATNVATNCVRSMEAELAVDFEHLSSFYNVLAVVFMYPFVAEVESKLRPNLRAEHPALAKKFAGDIVEAAFHNRGDKRIDSIVKRFVKVSTLEHSYVSEQAQMISTSVMMEVQLRLEEPMNARMNALFSRTTGATSHMWLKASSYYIGGERCILNTQNLVQMVFDVVQDRTKLMSKGDFFGPMWDECRRPARQIRGDMDALLAAEILPELIELSKHAPIQRLPGHRELMPLLDMISSHVRNRDEPVPISLTFGLHAMLTATFVLQCDGDVKKMGQSAKNSWHKIFSQLKEELETTLPQPPLFFANLNMFKDVRNLAKPIGAAGTPTAEENAFWNPMMGGCFVLFATHIASIGLGSAMVDAFGQLRLTLHLYNALKNRGLIPKNIELLDTLVMSFEKTKAVWVGGRPDEGSFMKSLLLSWGCSIEEANRRCREEQNSRSGVNTTNFISSFRSKTRDLDATLPEHFSVSYRRLVMNDSADAVDDYSVINMTEQEKKNLGKVESKVIDVVSNVNMVRDGFDDDENLIPLNLTRVGSILNQFICELSAKMGWDSIIKPLILSCPDEVRNGTRMDGSRARGGFQCSDANLERQAAVEFILRILADLDFADVDALLGGNAKKAAAFLVEFFDSRQMKDRCAFLIDVEIASVSQSSNTYPLLGTCPQGRTGKTARDPLAAFWHRKYSKRGEQAPRLIKPGKFTKYVTDGRDALSPYEERGSMLRKQPNGRYRHVASYSLEELIDLGWDGAKYVSKNPQLEGMWCPFIPGYDSDPDDDYDPIDVKAGKRAGIIGLGGDVARYMDIPNGGIVRLNVGH